MFICWKWKYFCFSKTSSIKLIKYISWWIKNFKLSLYVETDDIVFAIFLGFKKHSLNKAVLFRKGSAGPWNFRESCSSRLGQGPMSAGQPRGNVWLNITSALFLIDSYCWDCCTWSLESAIIDPICNLTLYICINFSDYKFESLYQENLSGHSWANTTFSTW